MLKNKCILFLKYILFCLVFATNIFAFNGKFVPKDDKILLIIGQDKESIQEYVNAFNIIPAGFMVYTSIQSMEGIYSPVNYGAGENHFQFLVEKYPNTVIQIGLWMVDGLSDTLDGAYDQNIFKLAKWAKSIKNPIFLRIGYEFDAPFNHYEPRVYIKTYKYIVNKLKEYKVDNIAFVWNSYASNNNINIEECYPGDEYVDWCGISYFHGNVNFMSPMKDFAKKHDKPLMICEATTRGIKIGVDENVWDRWYKAFFEFIYMNDVKAVCYINANWDIQPMWLGQGWGDTRVQRDEIIKNKWLNEISKDMFLNSSENLYDFLDS